MPGALATSVVNITADVSGLLKNIEKGTQAAAAKMKSAGRKMRSAGTTMTASLTLPAVAAGGAASNMAADFERSLGKITSLVGVSQGQVNSWRDDIMALSEETARAPKELADAMFFITSAGLRGAEALDVLEQSAKASAAGLGSTRDIANATTSALNAYGEENLSAAQATNVLLKAVREGKLEASELSDVIGEVIPLASNLGIEFREVAGSIATMSRIGLDANKASTALRGILKKITKVTPQSRKAFQKLGLSVEEMRRSFAERGLLPTLLMLKKRTDEVGVEMSKLFPRVRGLTGVLAQVGKNADNAQEIMKSMKDTANATGEAFSFVSSQAFFKFNQALTRVKRSAVELGVAILPTVVRVMDKLTGILNSVTQWFSSLSKSTQEWITWIAITLSALGPILLIVGQLTIALGGLAAVISTVAGFLAGLPAIIPIIAASLAALSGIVVAFQQNWLGIRDVVMPILQAVWNWVKKIGSALASLDFSNIASTLGSLLGGGASAVGGAISGLFSNLVSGIKSLIGKMVNFVTSNFNKVVSGIKSRIKSIISIIGSFIINTFNKIIQQVVKGSKQAMLSLAKSFQSVLQTLQKNPLLNALTDFATGGLAGGLASLAFGGAGGSSGGGNQPNASIPGVNETTPGNDVTQIVMEMDGEEMSKKQIDNNRQVESRVSVTR